MGQSITTSDTQNDNKRIFEQLNANKYENSDEVISQKHNFPKLDVEKMLDIHNYLGII